jgi:hypothetical protein
MWVCSVGLWFVVVHTVVKLYVDVNVPYNVAMRVVLQVCVISYFMAFLILVIFLYNLCTKSLEMFQTVEICVV